MTKLVDGTSSSEEEGDIMDVENESNVAVEEESNDEVEANDDGESANKPTTSRVYLPNPDKDKNEELECDESAYICYHQVKTGSPCLSFDILQDNLGESRADHYPLTMTLVGGTQNPKAHLNQLLILQLSNMHKNKPEVEEEDESESDEEEEKPILDCAPLRHAGCVNRVKVTTLGDVPHAASWSELGKVYIWDLSFPVTAVKDKNKMAEFIQKSKKISPVFTFTGHSMEGYAMEWSHLTPGVLATGDCKNSIHLWKPLDGGSWHVDQRPYKAHKASVEDIQWSPTESNVLASCSVDKSIRVWDIRAAPNKACMLTRNDAHDSDVNVISWNRTDPFILSGGDDGKLRVWDLRRFPDGDPICTFKYHTKPITSVEWHPTDASVFAASSADDILTQWDLATERDPDLENTEDDERILALPPQLLFMHQGQKEIKELHWHRQMSGVLVSTAESGLNVFRTVSI